MNDPFDLERFVTAQLPVWPAVVRELEGGYKRSHWMWFVFPQLRGLGSSSLAQRYGIGSLEEARALLAHAVLGPRLSLCSELVLAVQGRSLREIFGSPDDLKFRSSMSLFAVAASDGGSPFRRALERYCNGAFDERTLALLNAEAR